MMARLEHGGGQLGGVTGMLHLGHAEARSGAGRLDEQRILQAGFANLRHDRIGVGLEFGSLVEGTRVSVMPGATGMPAAASSTFV